MRAYVFLGYAVGQIAYSGQADHLFRYALTAIEAFTGNDRFISC